MMQEMLGDMEGEEAALEAGLPGDGVLIAF